MQAVALENRALVEPPAVYTKIEAKNAAIRVPMQQERILRMLATPVGDQAPLCITYPPLTASFELKTNIIYLLPEVWKMRTLIST